MFVQRCTSCAGINFRKYHLKKKNIIGVPTKNTTLCMPHDKAILIKNGEKAVMVDEINHYSTIAEIG